MPATTSTPPASTTARVAHREAAPTPTCRPCRTQLLTITKDATEASYDAVGDVIHYTIVADERRQHDARLGDHHRCERRPRDVHAGQRLVARPGRIDQLHGDPHGHPGRHRCRPLPEHRLRQRDGRDRDVRRRRRPGRSRTRISRSSRSPPSRATAHVGDVIHYTITATNDGNITLHERDRDGSERDRPVTARRTPVSSLAPGGVDHVHREPHHHPGRHRCRPLPQHRLRRRHRRDRGVRRGGRPGRDAHHRQDEQRPAREPRPCPNKTVASLPTADEGSTVTYTLTYTVGDVDVTNAVITDVLPAGLTVRGSVSATSNAEFTFVGYDSTTRTLTWTAATVTENGSVTYQALVLKGASELAQPLHNVATIDSDETQPDDATSDVFVPVVPLAETAPPTDVIASRRRTEHAGLQPDAHPRGPRRADPRDRLRHPGPGGGPPPEPPLGRSAAGRPIPTGGRRPADSLSLPNSCAATPSGVRPGRSTSGGVPRSFWCWDRAEVERRCRAGRSAADRRLEARVDELDRSAVVSATDALDRGVAVVAHLQMGQQDPAGGHTRGEIPDSRAVEVLRARLDRTRSERDLGQQRVARSDEDVEVLGAAAVARVDEAGPFGSAVRARRGSRSSRPCGSPARRRPETVRRRTTPRPTARCRRRRR